jgi:UDP-glucose 4-epimerase
MKILITGGSGFLGRNLIERLAKDGHELSCLDRFEAPFLAEFGVRMFQGDIFEKVLVEEAVRGQDAVIHMACTVIPKTSNDDPHFDVMSNVGGAIRLLDASIANAVGKFVFLSSGGTVYGTPVTLPISETHPTNPDCSYGITKLGIEKYLRLYRKLKGLKTCSLRLANPYGEHQRFHAAQGATSVFCYKALKGEAIDIWGDGSVRRDFIYIGDVVEAIVRAVETPGAVGEINIGSGRATSLNELLDAIESAVGRKTVRNYLSSRAFDVPVNYLDISRAKTMLGWSPQVGLEQGLVRTVAWLRQQL